jgi:hypothetical protein
MPKSFKRIKDPRMMAQTGVVALLLLNVAAALIAFHPWGGSADDLRARQDELRAQVAAAEGRLARSRALVSKVEHARAEGDKFLEDYVTNRRVSTSTIAAELLRVAHEAGIQQKETVISAEPVEGSDTLVQWTITAGYEGTYQNLTKFVNLLDKSERFLIIENMQATPQQSGANLNVSFKLDTFVRATPGSEL